MSADGGPDALVSGEVEGVHHLIRKNGRLVGRHDRSQQLLPLRRRRALAQLAARAEHHFGGPQDIEWAFDQSGTLFMFQSRPVTAVGAQATGPVLGPGPVAETFPDPLSTLEVDLWPAHPAHLVASRATLVRVRNGLQARSQNCWPSVNFDVGRVIDFFAGRSVSTDPRLLGGLTVSMLEGREGRLQKEF